MEGYSFSELYKEAERRFYSVSGLMLSLLLCCVVTYMISAVLGPPVRFALTSLVDDIPAGFFSYSEIVVYGFLLLGVTLAWGYKRGIPRFNDDKVGILFSSNNLDTLAKEVLELKHGVLEALKRHDLLNLIELKELTTNIKIHGVQDAFSALNKAKGKLLIWGTFEAGRILDKRHAGFQTINFTYSHPTNVTSQFHEQIITGLSERKWSYEERNDFIERSVLANNIAHVSLHIIGLILLAQRKFVEAEAILGPLDISLEGIRGQSRPSHLTQFCDMVRQNRVRCLGLQFSQAYDELLWHRGIYSVTTNELQSLGAKLAQAISLSKQDSALYNGQAIVHFLSGNIDQALKSAKKSKKMAERANSIPDFSLGFLFLYKGELRKGLQHYRIGLAKNSRDDRGATFEIVEFLRQVLEKHPEKGQFHYALGMINEEKLDPEIAREEYSAFITKCSNDTRLSAFVSQAQYRLDNLNKVGSR